MIEMLYIKVVKFRTKFEASGTSHDDEVVHCVFNAAFDYVSSYNESGLTLLGDKY